MTREITLPLPVSDLRDTKRRKIARRLLIELLSCVEVANLKNLADWNRHQFAFPVRWIDTQDVFFNREVLRYVEIGPNRTLANMAKRTAARQHGDREKSQSITWQFLSSVDDAKDIEFQYENDFETDEAQAQAEDSESNQTPPSDEPSHKTEPIPVPAPSQEVTKLSASPVVAISDTPLTAADVILALTSQKLKKPFDQISMDKSIRELSGGKSTLQNELIGDFGTEFGNLPDGAEEMPLSSLGTSLADSFSGQPGKQMSEIISKFLSSRMPGGFNQRAIRQNLQSRWGLGPERQTAVLCLSPSLEPSSRLTTPDAASEFFDSVVAKYGAYSNIELKPASATANDSALPTAVDPAALDSAKKEYRQDLTKIYEVLRKLVGKDDSGASVESEREGGLIKADLVEKLNQWEAEYGIEAHSGSLPVFDRRKIRYYDSWWNWVRVEIISLFYDLKPGQVRSHHTENRIRMILNRWTPSCADLVHRLASRNVNKAAAQVIEHTIVERGNLAKHQTPVFKFTRPAFAPQTAIDTSGEIHYSEVLRGATGNSKNYAFLMKHGYHKSGSVLRRPYIHLRSRHNNEWKYNDTWTDRLLSTLSRGMTAGLSFVGKTVLVTGAGAGSIASEVVRGLLEGGAEVLVTTSRPPSVTSAFFNDIYKTHGSRHSKLVLLPFNQGSKQDCEALIDHIYDNNEGYGGDLDLLIPFAAISETGELDGLDDKSEVAHRLMLVNLLRLLGFVKQQKAIRNFNTRPTNVILPLSPNHGTFGGDGLYPESKAGLETLLNRFHSETWATYLSICGAVIGWTRGTGLMHGNNILAEAVESRGAITFTTAEMAFNILALTDAEITPLCEDEPVMADLEGNLSNVSDLKSFLSETRTNLLDQRRIRKALVSESDRERAVLGHDEVMVTPQAPVIRQRSNLQIGFPKLSDYQSMIAGLNDLRGMVDLKRTIVVVGYSELGPLGSSRTRWEVENAGSLSPEGCMEMAWIMGLIEHFDGEIKGNHYIGWLDVKTKEQVHDDELKPRYEKHIMEHSGIRFIEPALFDGYDPEKKEYLHEVVVEEDLPSFEASRSTAEAFKLRHGANVTIKPLPGTQDYQVQVKKGAHFMVPKAIPFSRKVAGQLPSGFNPSRYGIPEDIISQVDPVVIYVLCCVCQAALSAGIKDPFELYRHIHVSELANCIGTGMGGLISMRGMYRDRYLDRPVQSDVLQESYLNAVGAWTNMLLLASTGSYKSPVGTCATAVESLESGCESILLGKAKVALVGGSDDLQEEMAYEFANMKATSDTNAELDKGRSPHEMCRPNTSSRSGFMESAGCGVQFIATAELALEMGLPIHAIVAHAQMAGDGIGRSVPAPGQGVLTAAREAPGADQTSLLDLHYRQTQVHKATQDVLKWRATQLQEVEMDGDHSPHTVKSIDSIASVRISDLQNMWSNDIRRQDAGISPIRAALAVWGLTVDDIQVATMHGTSTKGNDQNEAHVINMQMTKLGRKPGNPLLAISQKALTGHPKGAAAGWMFNGGMQVLQTGIVPGNRNADNIEQNLRPFEHLVYPSKTIHTSGVDAIMLTSFGFGQKGGIVIAIAPRYLYSAIPESVFDDYRPRVIRRQQQANLEFIRSIQNNTLFKAKTHPPWDKADQTSVFLDPQARLSPETLTFDINNPHPNQPKVDVPHFPPLDSSISSNHKLDVLTSATRQFLSTATGSPVDNSFANSTVAGIGVDVEQVSSISMDNETFLERNFTPQERLLAETAVDPRAFFAGRWSAKEALFKGLGVRSRGGGAGMRDIEVNSLYGAPVVELHGDAYLAAQEKGINDFRVSISHCEDMVMAAAVALRQQQHEKDCTGRGDSQELAF